MPEFDMELIKWVYVAFIVPIAGWIGWAIRAVWQSKRRNKAIIQHLCGLPPECKSILIDFYQEGTHTLRGDPMHPPIKLLLQQGVIIRGPGGGTYDAIDRYLSVAPDIWKVMDKWAVTDAFVLNRLMRENGN